MAAKFTLPAELVKAIAKLFSEIGTTVHLIFDGSMVRFVTMDPGKVAAAIVEAEPTVVMESEEATTAFDSDFFKRIANVLKREEITFEILEDRVLLTAEGAGVEKEFEMPALLEEPSKITRSGIIQKFQDKVLCTAVVTSEFLREAVNTLKKTVKPDSISITVEATRVILSAPSALQKVRLVGTAGAAEVQEIECTESITQFYPFEPVEAFAKNIKGATVRILIGHEMPLLLDAELSQDAQIILVASAQIVERSEIF